MEEEDSVSALRFLEVIQLMDKGMPAVARFAHEECRNAIVGNDGRPNLRVLPVLMDYILNLRDTFSKNVVVNWVKHLIGGKISHQDFSREMEKYHVSSTCGLVWTANFFAYRCRTCSLSPCMSICAACFQEGDHTDHDYNMFKSQAGGACDCGNAAVMKESGFCKNHGVANGRNSTIPIPISLSRMPLIILPRIIQRILMACRRPRGFFDYADVSAECDHLLNYLHEFIKLGSGARTLLRDALCNPVHYKDMLPKPSDLDYVEKTACQQQFENTHETTENVYFPPDSGVVESMQEPIIPKTFLDELIFWTVKYHFPEKLVYFLLNMKPDPVYEDALAVTFVRYYSRMSRTLLASKDSDVLGNSVVHITVQLFSDENLAYRMVDECSLLHIIVLSLRSMMDDILVPSIIHADSELNQHKVVNCNLDRLKKHRYWPLGSDLNNILSHRPIVEKFLSQKDLLSTWFKLLSVFQGMHVNLMELRIHVEFDSISYYAAFSAESQISATPLWSIVTHLKSPDTKHLTKMALEAVYSELEQWIIDIGFISQKTLNDEYNGSFHLPLHRNYALLLCYLVKYQGATLQEFIPSSWMFQKICYHPLKTLAFAAEVANEVWVRNGFFIKGQLMTYMEYQFCNYTIDLDLFFVQLACCELENNYMLQMILEAFQVYDLLTLENRKVKIMRLDEFKIDAMLDSFLIFMAQIVTTRTYLGTDEEALKKLEMATILCGNDRTHSQVFEFLPERCRQIQTSIDGTELLESLAIYSPPISDIQGTYSPKNKVWEEIYDPIHAALRLFFRKDNSIQRFRAYFRERENIAQGESQIWPPYRLARPIVGCFKDPACILADRSLHAVIFSLLYKIHEVERIPQHSLSLVIHILELTMEYEMKRRRQGKTDISEAHQSLTERTTIPEEHLFNTWYSTDDILVNVTKVIHSVRIRDGNKQRETPPAPSQGSSLARNVASILQSIRRPRTSDQPMEAIMDTSMDVSMQAVENIPTPDDFLVTGLEVETYQPGSSSALTPRYQFSPVHNEQLALTDTSEMALQVAEPHFPMLMDGTSFMDEERLSISMESTSSMVPMEDMECNDIVAYSPQETSLSIEYEPDYPCRTFNESIITLLLKLYDRVRDEGGPNFLVDFDFSEPAKDDRVGTGEFFIRKIFNKLGRYSYPAQMEIRKHARRLFPKPKVPTPPPTPQEIEARRKAARARKAKITEAFASKQKGLLGKFENDSKVGIEKDTEYMCVFCRKIGPASNESPIGIIALVMSTSTPGAMRMKTGTEAVPLTDEEVKNFKKGDCSQAQFLKARTQTMKKLYPDNERVLAMSCGFEGGVQFESCGHYIHMKCQESYVAAVRRAEEANNHAPVRRIESEYKCPTCRNIANVIIPLAPEPKDYHHGDCAGSPPEDENIISFHLKRLSVPKYSAVLFRSMEKFMEILTRTTYSCHRNLSAEKSTASLFSFVASIVRTNLETDLACRGGDLLQRSNGFERKIKSICIAAALHTLAYHAKALVGGTAMGGYQSRSNWTWVQELWNPYWHESRRRRVPWLFKDPVAKLIQIILLIPTHLKDRSMHHLLVRCYQLIVFRACFAAFSTVDAHTRHVIANEGPFSPFFSTFLHYLEPSMNDPSKVYSHPEDPVNSVTKQVLEVILVFLRPVALLVSSINQTDLPYIEKAQDEVMELENFIGVQETFSINYSPSPDKSDDGFEIRKKHAMNARPIFGEWCQQLLRTSSVTVDLSAIHRFHPPRLLTLPKNYDSLFKFYYRKTCGFCKKVPRDPALCLVCGTLICIRSRCCYSNSLYECVRHAISCGGGTAVYLGISRCSVIAVRGSGVCKWGCLYLDVHGEEDPDLKRGKEMYLQQARFDLLEQAWINHGFDHSQKPWTTLDQAY